MISRTKASIRTKLALLAGVPVIGALLLAIFVVNDARQGAKSAASLGSIEDLAQLSAYIAEVLHAVQDERAAGAIAEGGEAATPPKLDATPSIDARRETDAAAKRLESFLSTRDRSKLPPRLTRGLATTEGALRDLQPLRGRIDHEAVDLDELLSKYGAASSGLVSATAALAELSDDGAMLRNISAIVALLELEERSSTEHAIVGYAAARGEFPPGAFKALVTTATEERVYDEAFRTSASDDVLRGFESARARGRSAEEILDGVMKSTEDTVSLDPAVWNRSVAAAMRDLRDVERVLLGRIESAAAVKGAELKRTVRWSLGVAIAVIFLSVVMAIFVRRGIQGSVHALTDAAEKVRSSRDFTVRARRVSDDELGMLTETFNEMLAGIQSRDAELDQHRSHLEGLVVARTQELAARNVAMRLVLDNVDQGLATIGVDGALHSERSAAFDALFGTSEESRTFYDALSGSDEQLRLLLKLGWEQVVEGFLPTEVSLEQLPKRFDQGDRHFTLALKPILQEEAVVGALVVVSDVTSELEAEKERARQREEIQVFQRIARDKGAFLAFLEETGSIIDRLRNEHDVGAAAQLALVHTVKGNASQCEVRSVSDVAHELESLIVETGAPAGRGQLYPLLRAWDALGLQVGALVGSADHRIELSQREVDRFIHSVEAGLSISEIVSRLRKLSDEPVDMRLARLGEHAERLAGRLGKPAPAIEVHADDLRLPRGRYAPLWTGLVHVVRNAVDHGVESAAARTAAGKPAHGKISFRAWTDDSVVGIEIADDGAGIDWARVAEKAEAAGLPVKRLEDLERAIFASGVSTLDAVTATSGRGVGLAAVLETTERLGGSVHVDSELGKGTRFVFRIPLSQASHQPQKHELQSQHANGSANGNAQISRRPTLVGGGVS
jgi:two-component system, chemotaxis family, sensor kinase CheA